MNQHRLRRKSKKIQGRGFFSDAVGPFLKDQVLNFLQQKKGILEDKAKNFVHSKLEEIFSKKKKHGAGLKFL